MTTVQQLLLVGGGHAQLAVLRALAWARPDGWRVTLLTPQPVSLYSGMLPGWMAGHYQIEQCGIDLRPLAQAAGVSLRLGEAVDIDLSQRRVRLRDGATLAYDRLSLDVGSGIAVESLGAAAERQALGVLPVRPIAAFVPGWERDVAQAAGRTDFALAVLGAGAGGVELAFAARARLGCSVALFAGGGGLLPGHAEAVRRRTAQWLRRRGVDLVAGPARLGDGALQSPDGRVWRTDAVIAATGAQAPGWLAGTALAVNALGQVRVDAQQRSVSHPEVFAAGDCCQRDDGRLVTSGVHAVRAGPVLAHNLLASLHGAPLRDWTPRANSLYLLATGPRHAVLSWGRVGLAGRWVWRLKDRIDRGFIERHRTRGDAAA
jgi:pyridine nucleotide-disulfide oxidoreductase family protein